MRFLIYLAQEYQMLLEKAEEEILRLSEFLRKNRMEVFGMFLEEFDAEQKLLLYWK